MDASPTPPASPPTPPPVVINSKRYKKNLHALDAPSSHRWMVSYADFLTLLFALFVMLYSISSINEDKYRQLVSRLSGALNLGTPTDNTQVIVQEKIVKVVETKEVEVVVPTGGIAVNLKASAREEGTLDPLVIGFQPLLKEYKAPDGVGVALHVGEGWVELTMPSSLMFVANSQTLTRSGERLLDEISKTLKGKNFAVNVESFYHSEITPDPDVWPSSWAFTATRASNVVMGLESRGVDPTRLQASGYGAYYPIAMDTDPQGRAMNDRINLWIGYFDELRSRVLQLEQFELPNQAKRDSSKSANKRNDGK